MNMNIYRKTLYASRTESNLKEELELLRRICHYEKNGQVEGVNMDDLNSLVDHVMTDRPNRNELRMENIINQIRIADYQEACTILDMIYYLVGKKWSEDKSMHTPRGLAFAADNMGHGFYLGFTLKRDEEAVLVSQVNAKDELFLLRCRSMEVDRERFVDYCMRELGDEVPNEEIIKKINHNNDGAYIELPIWVPTLGSVILKNNDLNIWCELLIHLHYFPLQGSMIYSLNTVEQCIAVWDILCVKGYRRFKVVAYLLREHMIRLLAKESEMLERNAQSNLLSDEDLAFGRQLFENWNLKFDGYCCKMIEMWLREFGKTETAGWFSGQRGRLQGRPTKYIEYEKKTIETIEKYLTPLLEITEESIAVADYQTLLYYIKVAVTEDLNGDLCCSMVRRLCHLSYNERNIPQMKLETSTFDIMRNIYSCVVKAQMDGMKMMIEERYPMEGFHVDWDKAYRSCSADSLWLSTLLLQTETTEDWEYFWKVVDNLFRFANYEKSTVTDYYFMPFYIAEIIVVQIIKEQKDNFEMMMIDRISNLHFLLRVLTANEGVLSEENKEALRQRYEHEWKWEEEMISLQMREQTEFLKSYVEGLMRR